MCIFGLEVDLDTGPETGFNKIEKLPQADLNEAAGAADASRV
jgi:hypothetical protein